jgi:hypothetical protein
MSGDLYANYEIQANDGLGTSNWTVLGTMESLDGIWRYMDSGATNSAHRIYRARQLP